MIRKPKIVIVIVSLIVFMLVLLPTNRATAALPVIDQEGLRQDDLDLSDLDLLQAASTLGPWTEVPGSLSMGYTVQLDPAMGFYYFDAANLVVNRPLADDLYPFTLDTTSLPAEFYTYWEARGVTASASGGWEEIMWNIITGIEPMFYLKVDGASADLIDGLQYLASGGTLEEPLRVDGDYPLGDFAFNGTVDDGSGYTDDVVVAITFIAPLELSGLDLLQSTDQIIWSNAYGNFVDGFTMLLDPLVTFHYLDAENLVVNRPLANDLYPFYLDISSLPGDFYTYWAARGVTAGASGGWEEIMWDIITVVEPMFYLKVDGMSTDLVDGLQYLASGGTLEEPLRLNGDYPLGIYAFSGSVEDQYGFTDDVSISITFNDQPEAHDQSLSTDEDTELGITLTVTDQYPGSILWDYAQPEHGVVTGTAPNLTYEPDENWFGDDSFLFDVDDEKYGTDSGIISISVGPVNDPPVAFPQGVQTLSNMPLAILLEAEDVDGDPLEWFRGEPSHGSLSGVAPNLTYTPDTDYAGPDSFTFWVEDAEYESERVLVSIMVYEAFDVTNVNLQQSIDQASWSPVVGSLTEGYHLDLDTGIEFYYLDVTTLEANRDAAEGFYPFDLDTDSVSEDFYTYWENRGVFEGAGGTWEPIMWQIINGDLPMFYLDVTSGDNVLVDGLIYAFQGIKTYLRIDGDYWPGVYRFTGAVSDQLGYTDELTLELTMNDIPVGNSQSVATEVNTALNIVLTADDLFGEPLEFEITQDPSNGVLGGTISELTYTPNSDFIGMDSFEFEVTDVYGAASQGAVITIHVHEPVCLVVDPASLEMTLLQDTTDMLTLSITNHCTEPVSFEIVEVHPPDGELLLDQGFEGGQMPPTESWEVLHHGATANVWEIKGDLDKVYEGQYTAWVGYDDNNHSDEWLITPVMDFSSLSQPALTFWALSDTNWPGATMKLWALDESNQKLSAEPLWDMVQDESWGIWAYRFLLIDLRPYAGVGQLRIGWEYVGQGGQSFGLDLIKVGESSEVTWVSSTPETSTIGTGATQEVIVTFDAVGMSMGDYYSALIIDNDPYPAQKAMLTLHVRGDDQFLYIPMFVR